jgi:hypothetical protein
MNDDRNGRTPRLAGTRSRRSATAATLTTQPRTMNVSAILIDLHGSAARDAGSAAILIDLQGIVRAEEAAWHGRPR